MIQSGQLKMKKREECSVFVSFHMIQSELNFYHPKILLKFLALLNIIIIYFFIVLIMGLSKNKYYIDDDIQWSCKYYFVNFIWFYFELSIIFSHELLKGMLFRIKIARYDSEIAKSNIAGKLYSYLRIPYNQVIAIVHESLRIILFLKIKVHFFRNIEDNPISFVLFIEQPVSISSNNHSIL